MISIEEAKKQQFASSTRAELRKYAEQLGEEPAPNATAAQLKKMVFNALGMAMNADKTGPARAPVVTATRGGDKIYPSYNLTPSGIWGGRRHRITLPRPEGMKYAQAEGFSWNGKHPFYIPYNEVIDVPEPIYQIIEANKKPRHKNVAPEGGTVGESTTVWEFDDTPYSYRGVDPVTERRAGSLLEWYQSRGTEWFKSLSLAQLQLVAAKLEVSAQQHMGVGVPARILPQDELLGRIYTFLYGYEDAYADPNPDIED